MIKSIIISKNTMDNHLSLRLSGAETPPLSGELSLKATEGWKAGCLRIPTISGISRTFGAHPSDPTSPGHLKVNCPKGKRGHPGVPLGGEAWGSLTDCNAPSMLEGAFAF